MTNLPKKITKPVLKQLQYEGAEALKEARKEITGEKEEERKAEPETTNTSLAEKEAKDLEQGQRQKQALEAELEDIRRERKKREEEWEKEQEGKMQAGNPPVGGEKPLIEPKTKPKRGLFKLRFKRLQKSTETRLPPSG